MRTDRKTGEPILSPKLTADQLHAMANDPGWRPWMRLIAEHPHAWPGLVDWWRTAQEQGFDTAGAAPEPPESMRGRRRVAIPAAPLPPENGAAPEAADPVGSTDGWESVPLASEEGLAADPAPSPPEPEEDAGRQSPDPDRREEPELETMREALDDADDDFAALEQVADTEPSTMDIPPLPEPAETEPPMDDGTDTDPFADVRVRRAIPWKAIGITVAALLAVGLMAGGESCSPATTARRRPGGRSPRRRPTAGRRTTRPAGSGTHWNRRWKRPAGSHPPQARTRSRTNPPSTPSTNSPARPSRSFPHAPPRTRMPAASPRPARNTNAAPRRCATRWTR
ncbi:MAG: hypothetical protein ACLRL3_06125 [Bifidobacterium adolescentis]